MPSERNLESYMHSDMGARLRRAISQFWKYCIVGASGYVVNFLIYTILYGVAGSPYVLAATVSFAVSATNNFLLNKYWTFDNPQGQVSRQARRFIVVSLVSWSINMLMLVFMIEALSFNEYMAQAVAIVAVTLLNFTGNKLWSFRQPSA